MMKNLQNGDEWERMENFQFASNQTCRVELQKTLIA